ncbi:NAD-dependent epimerase/dehydratase family protein [Longispora albida]|uniref:NAD-dependent epimerase/dehydratase family protein n=1 Tax=Longispora albida TaxID=203523 RepID=UPI00037020B6|nr:NAD-dependent epimerase/dehydratase family protein [Longispora albida]
MHVVLGAGPVGSGTAELLTAAGHRVRVVTRSGTAVPGAEAVAASAADPVALRRATFGAEVIYNCVNPAYHRWATDWPPISKSILDSAAASGSVLVTMGNLYGYGPVDGPMTEALPLAAEHVKGQVRAAMWREAIAAHDAGLIRFAEARASDFFGPGALANSHLGQRVMPRLFGGRALTVIGSADQPHTWSYLPDVARAMVALGTDQRAWGHAWHVPSAAPATQREMIGRFAAAAGVPAPKVSVLPRLALRAAGLFNPQAREIAGILYQFDRPFVMDSSAATRALGLTATPADAAVTGHVAWWRNRLPAV